MKILPQNKYSEFSVLLFFNVQVILFDLGADRFSDEHEWARPFKGLQTSSNNSRRFEDL